MKLLSVAIPNHDANLSFFDGSTVRYLKLERTHQEKRFSPASPEAWKAEARAAFGDGVDDVDDVVFNLDPGALPAPVRHALGTDALTRIAQDRSKAEPLPELLCRHLGVRSGWLASHHFSHALSTWMLEGEPPDVHVVIDGLGDGRPWSIYRNEVLVAGGDIRNGSIGWGMREAGKLLGIRHGHYNDIAGKLMGLQAHGRIDRAFLRRLEPLGIEQLRALWSPQTWLAHKGDALLARHQLLDWAATVHHRMGEMLPAFIARFARPHERISYSGGVAQNVVWNARIREAFPRLTIPPHASDEGLSLGALEWLRRKHGLPPLKMPGFPFVQEDTAADACTADAMAQAVDLLVRGKVVGWYQGHGEVGPRALGNRSILMDPRIPDGHARLNRVKKREAYRPFGGSVLQEHADSYFDGALDAFMLHACKVRDTGLPAITHVDGSSRVQLVDGTNPGLRALLTGFHARTGCAVLANTSLNLAGRPIAAHPSHAEALFAAGEIDAMVIGARLLSR